MNKEAEKKIYPIESLIKTNLQVTPHQFLSNKMYRCVFDKVGIGIALINPQMEILAINDQMNKWYPCLNISSRPICYEAFNDPPRYTICSHCPTILTIHDGIDHEAMTETPSGNLARNFRVVASPIRNRQGNVIAAIVMMEDVTRQYQADKQLEISENIYRTLFENTGTIIILLEEDTTIAFVNTQFEKQTGYTKKEVEGRMSFLKWVPEPYRDQVLAYHHQRRREINSVPRQYELKMMNKDEELRDIFMTIDMIPGTKRSIASLIDITILRQSEEAIRKQKDELEDKAGLLEEINTALKVLLRLRDEDRGEIETRIVTNVKESIFPYLNALKKDNKDHSLNNSIQALETNLNCIISPFLRNLTLQYANLTPREIQIANLIKDGKITKEIAGILNCSIRSVEFHRYNMRKAFGLNNSKMSLTSYLASLS